MLSKIFFLFKKEVYDNILKNSFLGKRMVDYTRAGCSFSYLYIDIVRRAILLLVEMLYSCCLCLASSGYVAWLLVK